MYVDFSIVRIGLLLQSSSGLISIVCVGVHIIRSCRQLHVARRDEHAARCCLATLSCQSAVGLQQQPQTATRSLEVSIPYAVSVRPFRLVARLQQHIAADPGCLSAQNAYARAH